MTMSNGAWTILPKGPATTVRGIVVTDVDLRWRPVLFQGLRWTRWSWVTFDAETWEAWRSL